jgi:hypothetical protein
MAGSTAVVGGLVVVGLGAAVGHLQRIAEALATRAPGRSGRPFEMFEPGAARSGAAPGRVAFPPKPKAETAMREPLAAAPFNVQPPQSFAPSLPNPDEPPLTVEDEVSLSPQQHPTPPAQATAEFDEPARQESLQAPPLARQETPELDTGWHSPPPAPETEPPRARQPRSTFFDTMWPAEPKPADSPAEREEEPESAFERPLREAAFAPAQPAEEPAPPAEDEPRAVAILKSGVVDGMGYTLYVDGSIEAELPHGTLRFASINELRSHLEKTS